MSTFIIYILIFILLVLLIYDIFPIVVTRLARVGCVHRMTKSNNVALTFDDGPDVNYTPRLLDVLREERVHATFFVIAEKALQNASIVQRMMNEGHDIQIHGYKHWFVPLLGPKRTADQIVKSQQHLSQTFGIHATDYRPTWGLANVVSLWLVRRLGLRLVTWSVMVGDWNQVSSETLLKRIERKVQPGAIIVLHDSDETWGSTKEAPEQVIKLIPNLIRSLRQQGYDIGSLAELTREEAI